MTNEGRILQVFSNCNSEAKLQILHVTTQLLLIMVQIHCKKLKTFQMTVANTYCNNKEEGLRDNEKILFFSPLCFAQCDVTLSPIDYTFEHELI